MVSFADLALLKDYAAHFLSYISKEHLTKALNYA